VRFTTEWCEAPICEAGSRRLARVAKLLRDAADGCLPIEATKGPSRDVISKRARTGRRVRFTSAAGVRTEPIRWLIRGYVPLRGVTVVGGGKALGKSLLTNAVWAADVTRGRADGEFAGRSRDVLLCSAEDDWSTVIAPRLMAAGADLERVHYPDDQLIELPRDVALLEAEIVAMAESGRPLGLVVIDPIGAFLAGEIDSHRDASVRRALAPLAEMAMHTDVAVVVVAHLNKAEGSRVVNRVVGSVAFVNAARSFVAFSRDPEDPDGERGTRRVVVPTANNWGPLAKALSANVESRTVTLHDGTETSVGYLNVTGESEIVVEDLQRDPSEGADADDVEAAVLAALGDRASHTPREIKAAVADELGCSWRTVARAADRLEAEGLLVREHPDRPSLTRWRSLDTTPRPGVSKDQEPPETMDESLFGHMDTPGRVHRTDGRLAEPVAPAPDDHFGGER
jgi:hypothetical protein